MDKYDKQKAIAWSVVGFLLVCVFAFSVYNFQYSFYEAKRTIANLEDINTGLKEELTRSRETIDNLRTSLTDSAAANRRAAEAIRQSIHTADTIEGIIDAIIYGLDQLEKAVATADSDL